MEAVLPKLMSRQPRVATTKSREWIDLRGFRFRKSLRFNDTGHVLHCLQATSSPLQTAAVTVKSCDVPAEQNMQSVRKQDCKDQKKLMKSKRKVLKGVQEERQRFEKLLGSLKGEGVTADNLSYALQQFATLEHTLQQLLAGPDPNSNQTACMDSSSSSSESDGEMKVISKSCQTGQPASETAVKGAVVHSGPIVASVDINIAELPNLEGLPTTPSIPYDVPGRVLVCQGKKCSAAGARDVLAQVSRLAAGSPVEVLPCKCLGKCKQAPAMRTKVGDGAAVVHTNLVLSELHQTLQATFTANEDKEMPLETAVEERQLTFV